MKTLPLFPTSCAGIRSFVRVFELKKSRQETWKSSRTKLVYGRSIILNILCLVSFCYLLFPVIIFIIGFVRIELSIALSVLICYAFYRLIRDGVISIDNKTDINDLLSEWRAWRWHLLMLGFLALVWLSFSSIGGIGYRNFDSGIRSSLLWHLVISSWPVYFEAGYFGAEFGDISQKAYVYYFAYYLPAAIVGKMFGWKAANLALFAYSWVGASLALMLVRIYVHERGYVVTFMIFTGIALFGGMDYVFNRLMELTSDRSEMWLSPLHYFSHTRNLFWAPQHCLPTWLIIGIIINRRQISLLLVRNFPLAIVAMLLWSPLCLIGIAPFLLPILKCYYKEWLKLNLVNGLTFFLSVLLAAFIVSNDFSFSLLYAPKVMDDYWTKYSLLVLTEFLIISFVFIISNRKVLDSHLLITAFTLLFTIPILILGKWNDWSIKLSMAPLFVLSVFVIEHIVGSIVTGRRAVFISILLFAACAFTPLEELVYSARNSRVSFEIPPEIREFGPNYIVWQQLGDPDSFFFRYMARRP